MVTLPAKVRDDLRERAGERGAQRVVMQEDDQILLRLFFAAAMTLCAS